jgi:hypothetical protein
MTFTVFRAAQDCRALGSTVPIVVMNTQAEDQARWPSAISQSNPFDKAGKQRLSYVIFRRDEI